MPEARVLVVEDDQSLREVIAEALREDGYVVRSADNGQAALELARGWTPGVVILDLMMPHLDGEQFCGAMRQVQGLANIPIIVVSASRTAHEVGTRLGATASLRKPFDLFELTERVQALLG
jgi:DNA-binding response OmpR family regulator